MLKWPTYWPEERQTLRSVVRGGSTHTDATVDNAVESTRVVLTRLDLTDAKAGATAK